MARRLGRIAALAACTAAGALVAGTTAVPASAHGRHHPRHHAPKPVTLQLLSFNDFHGHLAPPTGGDAALPGATGSYGGSAYLASTLEHLRRGQRNSLTVAAGDLIGGSPIVSGLFKDEPAVEALGALGLDVSSVGNHEFDEGVPELLRMQYGGCSPTAGCFDDDGYSGADFRWLAANVTYKDGVRAQRPKHARHYGSWFGARTGRAILPPTWVTKVQGIKVGFIGMTLEGTPELVAQAGIRDVDFRDEVRTAGLAARDLRARGVQAIVVLLHEGGVPPTGSAYDFPCTGATGSSAISGPIVEIAKNLDPSIDMIVSGHTHLAYTCSIPDPSGRPRQVTSAQSYGRLVTETTLQLDRRTKDVIRRTATSVNHPVARTSADPQLESIVAKWTALAAPIANREVARITGDIRRSATRSTESSLADLIADAQRERTRVNGAQLALMNPGGVRADLTYASSPAGEGDGVVTYGEAFAVQPFANTLVTMTLSGAQLRTALEQQWTTQPDGSVRFLHLGISQGLTYSWSASAPVGSKVSDLRLDGTAVDPAASYRVTVNSFLADGGDGFLVLRDGTNRVGGGVDLDELIAHLSATSPVTGPTPNRATPLP